MTLSLQQSYSFSSHIIKNILFYIMSKFGTDILNSSGVTNLGTSSKKKKPNIAQKDDLY